MCICASHQAQPNLTLVWLYWNVGRIITEDIHKNQKRADYGQRLIEQLSARLARDHGRGFSAPNLWDMKRFFEAFEILQPVAVESAMVPILQTVSKESAKADTQLPPKHALAERLKIYSRLLEQEGNEK